MLIKGPWDENPRVDYNETHHKNLVLERVFYVVGFTWLVGAGIAFWQNRNPGEGFMLVHTAFMALLGYFTGKK